MSSPRATASGSTLTDGSEAVEFVSCSYLGLETHPELIAAATEALRVFGLHFSTSRNRGRPPYLGELEDLLSVMYGGAQVAAFTSVSNVHLGLLPLLGAGALPSYPVADAGVAFLVEKTAHASIQVIRGVLEQIGPTRRFDMTDPAALPAAVREAAATGRTPIVLVDGVGSMGGLIDVASMLATLEPFGGHLYVDDAHGTSIEGPLGAGYAFEALGGTLPPHVVLAGSLSKAFGGAGGFAVVPSDEDMRVLRKFANPLVFGHSIMLPMLAANVAAARLHVDGQVAELQTRLWRNAAEFDRLTAGSLVNAGLRSPVRGALFDTEEEAFAAARRLKAGRCADPARLLPHGRQGHRTDALRRVRPAPAAATSRQPPAHSGSLPEIPSHPITLNHKEFEECPFRPTHCCHPKNVRAWRQCPSSAGATCWRRPWPCTPTRTSRSSARAGR